MVGRRRREETGGRRSHCRERRSEQRGGRHREDDSSVLTGGSVVGKRQRAARGRGECSAEKKSYAEEETCWEGRRCGGIGWREARVRRGESGRRRSPANFEHRGRRQ
jgi:hypothetical protein